MWRVGAIPLDGGPDRGRLMRQRDEHDLHGFGCIILIPYVAKIHGMNEAVVTVEERGERSADSTIPAWYRRT